MKYEVQTAGRRRTIEVRRSGAQWDVVVDGRPCRVDLERSGPRWSMLVRPAPAAVPPAGGVDGADGCGAARSYEIAVEPTGRGRRLVHVDGHAVEVALLDGAKRPGEPAAGAPATGRVAVASSMPGRVVKVLVAPGETVAARQGLVVVEAMKMENEIRAPRAGTVSEIRAREGAPVESNTILVILD